MKRPPRAACPTCGREVPWAEDSTYRPFCSERCRLIDLGAWLDERHAIPGEPAPGSPPGKGPPRDERG